MANAYNEVSEIKIARTCNTMRYVNPEHGKCSVLAVEAWLTSLADSLYDPSIPQSTYIAFLHIAPAQTDLAGYLWVSLNELANKVCDRLVGIG
jgi:hypothetical protein